MIQSFKIGKLTLIQDDLGYSVAQDTKDGEAEIVASFKHPLDAVEYFAKYCFVMAELDLVQQGGKKDEKEKN